MVQILRDIHPVARKEHKCMFCGGTIKVGKKYNRQTNVYDGAVYDFTAHEECTSVAHELNMYDDCDDNGLGEEVFCETLDEYVYANHYDDNTDDIDVDWQLSHYEIAKKILEELSRESNEYKL